MDQILTKNTSLNTILCFSFFLHIFVIYCTAFSVLVTLYFLLVGLFPFCSSCLSNVRVYNNVLLLSFLWLCFAYKCAFAFLFVCCLCVCVCVFSPGRAEEGERLCASDQKRAGFSFYLWAASSSALLLLLLLHLWALLPLLSPPSSPLSSQSVAPLQQAGTANALHLPVWCLLFPPTPPTTQVMIEAIKIFYGAFPSAMVLMRSVNSSVAQKI